MLVHVQYMYVVAHLQYTCTGRHVGTTDYADPHTHTHIINISSHVYVHMHMSPNIDLMFDTTISMCTKCTAKECTRVQYVHASVCKIRKVRKN